jgi:hypothetical protein
VHFPNRAIVADVCATVFGFTVCGTKSSDADSSIFEGAIICPKKTAA